MIAMSNIQENVPRLIGVITLGIVLALTLREALRSRFPKKYPCATCKAPGTVRAPDERCSTCLDRDETNWEP